MEPGTVEWYQAVLKEAEQLVDEQTATIMELQLRNERLAAEIYEARTTIKVLAKLLADVSVPREYAR